MTLGNSRPDLQSGTLLRLWLYTPHAQIQRYLFKPRLGFLLLLFWVKLSILELTLKVPHASLGEGYQHLKEALILVNDLLPTQNRAPPVTELS